MNRLFSIKISGKYFRLDELNARGRVTFRKKWCTLERCNMADEVNLYVIENNHKIKDNKAEYRFEVGGNSVKFYVIHLSYFQEWKLKLIKGENWFQSNGNVQWLLNIIIAASLSYISIYKFIYHL